MGIDMSANNSSLLIFPDCFSGLFFMKGPWGRGVSQLSGP